MEEHPAEYASRCDGNGKADNGCKNTYDGECKVSVYTHPRDLT